MRDTDSKSGSPETVLTLDILRESMKSRKVQLDALYRKRVDSFSQQYYTEHGATADAAKAAQEAATRAMSLLLAVCQGLCRESEEMNAMLCAPEAGVEAIASGFSDSYGKGAAHWLSTQLVPDGGKSGFGTTLLQLVQAQKPAGGSFFSKLFGKKK